MLDAFVGFDTILTEMERMASQSRCSFPPYNLIKESDDDYVIEVAIAGYNKDEIYIGKDKDILSISYLKPAEKQKSDVTYIHKGIAKRSFKLDFCLADYVDVSSVDYANGMLFVRLVRELPEEERPKQYSIGYSKQRLLTE